MKRSINLKTLLILMAAASMFAVIRCSEDLLGLLDDRSDVDRGSGGGDSGETSGGASGGFVDKGPVEAQESAPYIHIPGTFTESITVASDSQTVQELTDENGQVITSYEAQMSETVVMSFTPLYSLTIDEVNDQALTISDPEGNEIATTYYIESIDTEAATVTLTDDVSAAEGYTASFVDYILSVNDGEELVNGYVADFDAGTLTLVDHVNVPRITVENNTVAMASYDNVAPLFSGMYIELVDINNVTLSDIAPDSVIGLSAEGNALVVDTGGSTIGGYLAELVLPARTMTVDLGDGTAIRVRSDEIVVLSSELTIDNVGEEPVFLQRLSTSGAVAAYDENSTKYNCSDTSYTPLITVHRFLNIEIDGDYCLGRDLDLSGIANFAPLASNANPFVGNLDGSAYKIIGLVIDRSSENYVGVFADVGTGAEIKNLVIENPSVAGGRFVGVLAGNNKGTVDGVGVTGPTQGTEYMVSGTVDTIGGLVGKNQWIVRNSYAEGRVQGGGETSGGLIGLNKNENTSEDAAVVQNSHAAGYLSAGRGSGGLVGRNQGAIADSYADVEVVATDYSVGGLVGRNGLMSSSIFQGDAVTITRCYAVGEVQSPGENWIGGLVGTNFGRITDSYASGAVSGKTSIGALVGWSGTNTSAVAVLENSYATGTVTLTGATGGGLLGSNGSSGYSGGRVVNCYFDITTTTQTAAIGHDKTGSQSVTGYSTDNTDPNNPIVRVSDAQSAAIVQSDFEGDPGASDDDWDFSTVWTISSGAWPTLQ